ncbi:CoA-binding protein [Uliginosibacterium gangwonense]|uniref:CoA-binding protein n=1 Tax=Uliginosibacterium gangwonense TaxID=392736 RepID=UPI000369490C|nr:CoA-binding protein [Uliginosibacterium gangwonense]
MFANPSEDDLRSLLKSVKTIAVVGLSPKEDRPSYHVAAGLQKLGFRIVPVHPTADTILGEKVYASLRDIPFAIDVADVFRDPAHIAPIIDDAIAIKAPHLWLQEGVVNEAEALRAQAAGMQVVMDRCIWRDAVALLV